MLVTSISQRPEAMDQCKLLLENIAPLRILLLMPSIAWSLIHLRALTTLSTGRGCGSSSSPSRN
jgi:hypothetical protein